MNIIMINEKSRKGQPNNDFKVSIQKQDDIGFQAFLIEMNGGCSRAFEGVR